MLIEKIPKFFLPVYLKSGFAGIATEANTKRMIELEEEIINNINTVPRFAKSLFVNAAGPGLGHMQNKKNYANLSFLEEEVIRPKNIQWRYEFRNFFPEGYV